MPETSRQIADLIREGKKIEAIKLLRESTGVDLKQAKDEIDRLSDQVAGQAPPPVLPAPLGKTLTESLSKKAVELVRQGKKIQAIKLVREHTGMGLKEAKEEVEALTGGAGSGCMSALLLLILAGIGVALAGLGL
jgi:ribosomal protein L7/L12